MEEMIKDNKKITFKQFLIAFSVVMSICCCVGWYKLSRFIDSFENSLMVVPQSTQSVEVPTEQDVIEQVVEYLPIDHETEFQELALTVAQKYANYTSGDLKFNELKGYFQSGTAILELLESYNSNRYNSHEKCEFENIDVSRAVVSDVDVVEVKVAFDYVVITSENVHYYPSTYGLYFDYNSKLVLDITME